MKKNFVAVHINDELDYPDKLPFSPDQDYPEHKADGFSLDPDNKIYEAVRNILADFGLDNKNQNSENWNPFSEFIKKDDHVLIKPNLVLHYNGKSSDIRAVVTHASLLRPIIDYALLALNGTGEVIIGDAPHGNADFDKIVSQNCLNSLVEWYQQRNKPVRLVDFRKFVYGAGPSGFVDSICREVNHDPWGYALVDLGEKSFLNDEPNLDKLYGSDYNRKFIVSQHENGKHQYLVSGSVLNADVIINVPKMKTHKKTGITINLKNLVGINGDKNYLAHYRIGSPAEGGDEYADTNRESLCLLRKWNHFAKDHLLAPNTAFLRRVYKFQHVFYRFFRKITNNGPAGHTNYEMGNWFGNDTTWRMCLDLNYILFYADKQGKINNIPQRTYFSLVDGVVSGEGNGPMNPTARKLGLIAAGTNPFEVDYVCASIMGFDTHKIKLLEHAPQNDIFGIDKKSLDVHCRANEVPTDVYSLNYHFQPHWAWQGHIERDE